MNSKTRGKALIGVAVAIAAYVAFGPTDVQTVEVAKNNPTAASVREPHAKVMAPGRSAMRTLLLLAHRVSDTAASGALFATHSWYVPPPPAPPAPLASTAESLPPPVPTAPPLPFTYMGTFKPDGATPVFFLTEGDRVYDVHIGETLDNVYSVDGLSNGQLLLTYKPLNIKQQLSVGSSP
jgi:hypothetical protein